ncbi:hypothetical protein GGR26_003343 [Lewinella marina]|uniref:Lipocalin-like domain-containing protein n=1 Tax=Neolewinella marina TaxID=438751 RepID=A0A2G0CCP3_9BACT|nr:hypothetical protein [Neolewinella marina]NJB87559.1 hypothetical protein [Neolewinella marina]PHK97749.1 hypothetical protein CGL56_15095 [Neolewinella marina]
MRKLFFALVVVTLAACSSPRTAADSTTPPAAEVEAPTYAGEWDVVVRDTPAGTVTGSMILEGGPDGLSGKFLSNGRETTLRSVEPTEGGLKILFYSSEYMTDVYLNLNGEPSDDELTGTALDSYAVVATRKM